MKFKLKQILFLLIILILCSFVKKQNININKTGFSEICLNISNEFKKNNEHGEHIYNSKTEKYLSLLEFSKIIKIFQNMT